MKDINQLAEEYKNIEIPEDLEWVVKRTIIRREKSMKRNHLVKTVAVSAAALIILFVGTVNASPAAAQAMSKIPAIKPLVELVTIKELTYEDEKHEVDIQVPQVEGLENSDFEAVLNEKYRDENTKLYEEFMKQIGENELTPQNLALYTNYTIKVETKDLMVIEGIKTEIMASGCETVQYDNIDLKNQMIITLPSLFKDNSYIDEISENIKLQMKQRMEADENEMYFMKGDEYIDGFDKIKEEQSFYINEENKLVVSFDEYEAAPGCMGIVEFIIPTEEIQDLLVSNTYIK